MLDKNDSLGVKNTFDFTITLLMCLKTATFYYYMLHKIILLLIANNFGNTINTIKLEKGQSLVRSKKNNMWQKITFSIGKQTNSN